MDLMRVLGNLRRLVEKEAEPRPVERSEEPLIEVYFSPDDDPEKRVLRFINEAERRLDVAMYAFTFRPFADAMVHAHGRKVALRVIMDKGQLDSWDSQKEIFHYLKDSGIDVIPDIESGLMHLKVVVADGGQRVLTGSFNFSKAAQYQRENLVVINEPVIGGKYQRYFDKVWKRNKRLVGPADVPAKPLM